MVYVTLQEKLAKLKNGDQLPIDLLHELLAIHPTRALTIKEPFNSEHQYEELPMSSVLKNVTHWEFDRWMELECLRCEKAFSRKICKHKQKDILYWEAKTKIFLDDGRYGFIHIYTNNFYSFNSVKYNSTYVRLLLPGKLAYVAEEELFGLTMSQLLYDNTMDHELSGVRLTEGEAVMILETIHLIEDSITLVKFLYKESILWTYGTLYEKDYFTEHSNDNHWI
jgi:hypothetical protein